MAETSTAVAPKESPAIREMRTDIAKDEGIFTQRQSNVLDKQTQIAAEREKTLGPMEQSISEQLAEPPPQRQRVEIPQFEKKPLIDAKEYETLSYGLIAMALIGGAASKGNWLGVGASLNGALKGYLEGNEMVAEKRYKDFNQEFKVAMAKEDQANREFEDILRNKKMRIQDQINQYRIVAAKYDRQDAVVAAQSRSLDAMWRSLESRKTAMARLQESHDRATENLQFRRDMLEDKKKGAQGNTGISDKYRSDPEYKKQVDYWADYFKKVGSLPARFAQSGAGKAMYSDIVSVVPASGEGPGNIIANKLSVREMTAEAQKLGTQAASVAIANKEMERFIPAAEKAMADVPRTGWKPINQLIQAGENTWSPEQKRLVIANRAVQTAYAQLIQRGAPTVHSSEEAEKMLTTSDSPAVYKGALEQLRIEGKQAELGLQDARDELLKRAKETGSTAAPVQRNSDNLTPPSGKPLTNSKGWTLHHDAAGNWAYVGPNNEIEEVRQ
jgi:hypothetical protein